jgi:hypothetical protein
VSEGGEGVRREINMKRMSFRQSKERNVFQPFFMPCRLEAL